MRARIVSFVILAALLGAIPIVQVQAQQAGGWIGTITHTWYYEPYAGQWESGRIEIRLGESTNAREYYTDDGSVQGSASHPFTWETAGQVYTGYNGGADNCFPQAGSYDRDDWIGSGDQSQSSYPQNFEITVNGSQVTLGIYGSHTVSPAVTRNYLYDYNEQYCPTYSDTSGSYPNGQKPVAVPYAQFVDSTPDEFVGTYRDQNEWGFVETVWSLTRSSNPQPSATTPAPSASPAPNTSPTPLESVPPGEPTDAPPVVEAKVTIKYNGEYFNGYVRPRPEEGGTQPLSPRQPSPAPSETVMPSPTPSPTGDHSGVCDNGRRVVLKQERPGKDPVVGKDRSDYQGYWRVTESDASGVYYTIAKKRVVELDSGTVICARARSQGLRPPRQ
ncbi:MAG TPA: hypothetical protein VNC78_01550 [Actinomycetota bacterium]|nr:hypothetical protein [Actinomycetota bacterium]